MKNNIDIFKVAEAIASKLNVANLLPENVFAKVDPVPEFELSELETIKVPILPANHFAEIYSRGTIKHRIAIDIGLLKRIESKAEIIGLVNLMEKISLLFFHESFMSGDFQCDVQSAEINPLYSPEDIRQENKFFSVCHLEIEAYENQD